MNTGLGTFSFACLGVTIAPIAGCVEQATQADVTTFRFAWWVPALALVCSIIAVHLGLRIRRHVAKLGFILVWTAPICATLVVPGLIRDRVVIDSNHFSLDTGLWFAPSRWSVRFDDVASISYVAYVDHVGVSARKYKLVLQLKSGGKRTVPSGDLMRHAVPTILLVANSRGVPVTDKTQNP